MSILDSVGAIAGASGEGTVDWAAATEAATAATDPGSIDLDAGEREGYAEDVRVARRAVREAAGIDFDVPETIAIQNRHHWIEANVDTFRTVMEPLADRRVAFPGFTRRANTATMATMLSFLGRNVLGQYDPLLLADGDPKLYFVRPNVRKIAEGLDAEYGRFRRWIVVHEVTHAAEFGAAPWLSDHLETRMQEAMERMSEGRFDRSAFGEIDVAMTAVEGYAEAVMDRALDAEYDDLRAKIDARRGNRGPIAALLRRVLGLGMKRRQYERGKEFFDAVIDARGVEGASVVWDDPENLPREEEIEEPTRWLARVDG
ncbi:MAG: zinc-dependent metalloprotease [Halobacteriales archaeon]